MNEIIYINNIKERLFNHLSEEQFNIYLKDFSDLYQNKSNHVWYDIKYLNSCLDLFFIYFNKFNDPLSVFYSFFFKDLEKLRSFTLDKKTKQKISYFNHCSEFILNDLNIKENDFDLYKSILIYNDYICIPTNDSSKLYSGLSVESEKGLSFKFKRICR